MNKFLSLSLVLTIFIFSYFIFFKTDNQAIKIDNKFVNSKQENISIENTEIKNNIQFVKIFASSGYKPQFSKAKSNIETRLIITTKDTYDCSSSLVINSINYRKMLKPNGEEIVNLGVLRKGDKIEGVCSMGMYSFVVEFE